MTNNWCFILPITVFYIFLINNCIYTSLCILCYLSKLFIIVWESGAVKSYLMANKMFQSRKKETQIVILCCITPDTWCNIAWHAVAVKFCKISDSGQTYDYLQVYRAVSVHSGHQYIVYRRNKLKSLQHPFCRKRLQVKFYWRVTENVNMMDE